MLCYLVWLQGHNSSRRQMETLELCHNCQFHISDSQSNGNRYRSLPRQCHIDLCLYNNSSPHLQLSNLRRIINMYFYSKYQLFFEQNSKLYPEMILFLRSLPKRQQSYPNVNPRLKSQLSVPHFKFPEQWESTSQSPSPMSHWLELEQQLQPPDPSLHPFPENNKLKENMSFYKFFSQWQHNPSI